MRITYPSPRYSGEKVAVGRMRGMSARWRSKIVRVGSSQAGRPLTPALSPEYRGEGDSPSLVFCASVLRMRHERRRQVLY